MLYWADSIGSKDGNTTEVIQNWNGNFTAWKRPTELENNPSLWGPKGVRPEGVHQGGLGDCWFMAAASAVAEYPQRIKNVFTNTAYTKSGIFQFEMFFKGMKKLINIDDRFAQGLAPGRLLAAQKSSNGAWWLPLLEKAMAKLNVNYISLRGGQPAHGMRTLTGMPSASIKNYRMSLNKVIDMIKEADRKKYILTASCWTYDYGLTAGHAYTLLGVYNLKGETVFKMRNPWSSERYNGPWKDTDSRWTSSLRR